MPCEQDRCPDSEDGVERYRDGGHEKSEKQGMDEVPAPQAIGIREVAPSRRESGLERLVRDRPDGDGDEQSPGTRARRSGVRCERESAAARVPCALGGLLSSSSPRRGVRMRGDGAHPVTVVASQVSPNRAENDEDHERKHQKH